MPLTRKTASGGNGEHPQPPATLFSKIWRLLWGVWSQLLLVARFLFFPPLCLRFLLPLCKDHWLWAGSNESGSSRHCVMTQALRLPQTNASHTAIITVARQPPSLLRHKDTSLLPPGLAWNASNVAGTCPTCLGACLDLWSAAGGVLREGGSAQEQQQSTCPPCLAGSATPGERADDLSANSAPLHSDVKQGHARWFGYKIPNFLNQFRLCGRFCWPIFLVVDKSCQLNEQTKYNNLLTLQFGNDIPFCPTSHLQSQKLEKNQWSNWNDGYIKCLTGSFFSKLGKFGLGIKKIAG